MRPTRLALAVLAVSAALAACSAPAETTSSRQSAYVPPTSDYGPGDYCADTYVLLQPDIRTNFSLGSENYRNQDYCAAYPYLKAVLAEEPLYTGEEPDDRNYLRMATVYEAFAAQVDSTNQAEQKAYLDSALATRAEGVAAMRAAGITFDPYLRDLREGFFYFQNSAYYPDAEERQFEAFRRAFEAQPDSLEDWYLSQLFIGSAAQFGNETPNPERAAFVRRLAQATDTPALSQNYQAYATYLETEPQAGTDLIGSDEAVERLVADLRAGTIADNDALSLLAVVLQQPERIEDLNEDIAQIRSSLLRLPVITNQVDNPRTLVALAFQNFRDGNTAEGNRLFDRALENAASNAQRADFLYSRATAGFGNTSQLINRALQVYPQHGPSLYRRAGLIADAVGRPSTLRGRFAYWCLADEYRQVAAVASDSRIASAARRAAAQYDRAGPSREQYFLEGFQPGQTVTASLGAYGSCTTRVR